MSQAASTRTRTRRILQWGTISLILVAAIWFSVILWWQSGQRLIRAGDVVFYLIVLPVAALFLLFCLLWRLKIQQKKAAVTAAALSLQASRQKEIQPEVPASTLPVLSAWSITSAADNPADFLQALTERQQRPRPDAGLRDAHGFPLHAGRIKDLDTLTAGENLAQLLALKGMPSIPGTDGHRVSFLRSMALLFELMDQIGAEWPLAPDDGATTIAMAAGTLRGTHSVSTPVANQLQLHVKLLVPADFQAAEQKLALDFLLDKASALLAHPQHLHAQVIPAQDDASILWLAEQFRIDAMSSIRPQALLLMACESTLCESVVEKWQASGKIFSSQSPSGLMMGEAGFAIMCINHAAMPLALCEPVCQMSQVCKVMRDAPADGPDKPSSLALVEVICQTLLAAGIAGEKISAVACDADHRTSRVLECIGAMMHHTPQLDAVSNRLATSETCGHTGAASVAGSWVAGIMQAHASRQPVLLFNVGHLHERAAALLVPQNANLQPS